MDPLCFLISRGGLWVLKFSLQMFTHFIGTLVTGMDGAILKKTNPLIIFLDLMLSTLVVFHI